MQTIYGGNHFNFIPKTFILPKEYIFLIDEMKANREQVWILKPSASSQGRGIFFTRDPSEVRLYFLYCIDST
jgi:glutathione synthase/RimK-type ligase-like ATP-grasp enzyme